MVTPGIAVLAVCIVLQRLAELRVAAANRQWIIAAGGREYGRQHYPWFFIVHAGWLAGWLFEACWRLEYNRIWPVWFVLFILAQGLRYWCLGSLGRFWNTRIFVIPGRPLVQEGPYRYFKHPNYMAVAVELMSVPLIFDAWITAITATIVNSILLLKIRIPAEEAALREASQAEDKAPTL